MGSPRRLTHVSGFAHLTLLVIIGFLTAAGLAGCCGGMPSHYCKFTPADAGKQEDAAGQCFGQTCVLPQVCCIRRNAPPYASCQDQANFEALGCEKPPTNLDCTGPSDCQSGQVCCVQYAGGQNAALSCSTTDLCPGQGVYVDGTAWLCTPGGASTCATSSQQCLELSQGPDAGMGIYMCQ